MLMETSAKFIINFVLLYGDKISRGCVFTYIDATLHSVSPVFDDSHIMPVLCTNAQMCCTRCSNAHGATEVESGPTSCWSQRSDNIEMRYHYEIY